jgi:hypothetical protein
MKIENALDLQTIHAGERDRSFCILRATTRNWSQVLLQVHGGDGQRTYTLNVNDLSRA